MQNRERLMGFDFGGRTDRTQTFAILESLSRQKNKAEMSSYCRGCYNNIWWYLWTVVGHFRQYGAGRVLWGLGQYRAGATWRKQQSLSETELQTSYLLCCTENQPWSWTSSWVFATGKSCKVCNKMAIFFCHFRFVTFLTQKEAAWVMNQNLYIIMHFHMPQTQPLILHSKPCSR